MKHTTITDTLGWPQRTPRVSMSAAEYGDPVSHTEASHRRADRVIAIFAIVFALSALWGWL
jgi:hypothetical protein